MNDPSDMHEFTPSGDFKTLVDRFLDETITDDEMRVLDSVLDSLPGARSFFLHYTQMHIELGVDAEVDRSAEDAFDKFRQNRDTIVGMTSAGAATTPIAPLAPLPPDTGLGAAGSSLFYSLWQPTMVFGLGILAAAIGLGIAMKWGFLASDPSRVAKNGSSVREDALTPVAYLTSANGCDWESDSLKTWTVANGVELGSVLALREGIAEFEFANNVHLTLEGPAAVSIASPESLLLQYGKLTVRVPWEVKDFRLIAGSCRMTACDSEMGVIVKANQVELHSFTGGAKLLPTLFSGDFDDVAERTEDEDDGSSGPVRPIEVKEGQAIVLPATGDVSIKPIPADRNKFAAKLSMGGKLPVTKEYIDAVKASRPVGYWRFESVKKGQVKNEIPDGESLKVVGKVSFPGDGKNHSLETRSKSHRGHLVGDLPVPLSGTDYSVEIWCKPSHFHRGTLVALGFEDVQKRPREILHHALILQTMRDGDEIGSSAKGASLQNYKPGSIRFLHRNPPNRDPRTGTSCYSDSVYHLRHWQHIVAVKEKSTLRLYRNGVLAGTMEDATPIAQNLRLIVGEAYFRRSDIQPSRPFYGQLDELAIYNRALREEEIIHHYQAIDFEPENVPAQSSSGTMALDLSTIHKGSPPWAPTTSPADERSRRVLYW